MLKVFPKFRAFQKPNLPFLNPTVASAPFPKIRRPLQYPVAPKPKPDRLPDLPLIGFQWPYISPPFSTILRKTGLVIKPASIVKILPFMGIRSRILMAALILSWSSATTCSRTIPSL
jgi:hypothetical protein